MTRNQYKPRLLESAATPVWNWRACSCTTLPCKGRPPVFVGRDAEAVRLTDMHPQLADNNGSSGLLVEPFLLGAAARSAGWNCFFWRRRMSNRAAGCRKRWRTDCEWWT